MADKNRYWVAVLYPENMIEDWEASIGDILQVPFSYCIHDHDLLKDYETDEGEKRKIHVHIIVAFPNTTTYKHAMTTFQRLSRDGCNALNTCLSILNIRHMYEYLIHNTEECRKKGKYQYPKECRISGNNFDIGGFEQLSTDEKNRICYELCNDIIREGFVNFVDFYMWCCSSYDPASFEAIKSHNGLFDRICKGNYLKSQLNR